MSSKWPQDFFRLFAQENCHSSKSVNSFGMGPIFLASLGQELSRNAFVASILSFWKKLSIGKDFFITPKNRDFHEISSFLESCREASRKLLGCLESVPECFRVSRNDFWTQKKIEKRREFRYFWCF